MRQTHVHRNGHMFTLWQENGLWHVRVSLPPTRGFETWETFPTSAEACEWILDYRAPEKALDNLAEAA